ncbi:hypothetical protein RHSIM_Rhsim06G0029500 [Rhododendron simsii]|uniref:Uncharacterized protein n=1 Tax=Rhododendron simsii TaxID=118357 RepID=A0A834LM28_RHOSS|nr:hypothetical protein RHSIM_Rhsim06G0029500 [Rhododendron simsii]
MYKGRNQRGPDFRRVLKTETNWVLIFKGRGHRGSGEGRRRVAGGWRRSPVAGDGHGRVTVVGLWLYASFIDLDMKPLNKMERYYELDQQIVSCYTDITNGEHQLDNSVSIGAYRTAYSDHSNTVEDASHARDPTVMGA